MKSGHFDEPTSERPRWVVALFVVAAIAFVLGRRTGPPTELPTPAPCPACETCPVCEPEEASSEFSSTPRPPRERRARRVEGALPAATGTDAANDRSALLEWVRLGAPPLRACLVDGSAPHLSFAVRLVVDSAGKVTSVHLDSTGEAASPAVRDCLAERIGRWEVPLALRRPESTEPRQLIFALSL
jgi:hypothetical protein